MLFEQETADALPSILDISDLLKALSDPDEIFRMLDLNSDECITKIRL